MNRTLGIAIALLATTTIASAEPAPATEPTPQPSTFFVDGGFVLGGDTIGPAISGLTVEGGVHLHRSLWAHGMVIEGEPANFVQGEGSSYSGTYRTARAGIENRLCSAGGAACFTSGLDLGLRHFDAMNATVTDSITGAQAVVRAGLDVGGGHVRFRPALEGMLDLGRDHGHAVFDGLALTMTVGYQR